MKHRIVHFLQKYLFDPPVKLLFAIGLVPPGYALLETTGRKTGKPRRTPVGNGLMGGQFWIVAEHGQKAGFEDVLIQLSGYLLTPSDSYSINSVCPSLHSDELGTKESALWEGEYASRHSRRTKPSKGKNHVPAEGS